MLDFYYIFDSEDIPDNPPENRFIESLSLEEFYMLNEIIEFANANNIQFTFFEDFRIKNSEVRDLLKYTDEFLIKAKKTQRGKLNSYKKLDKILKSAATFSSGIFAFCD